MASSQHRYTFIGKSFVLKSTSLPLAIVEKKKLTTSIELSK